VVKAAKKGVSLENNTLANIDTDFAARLAISALQLRASMERRYVVINIAEFPIIDAYVSRNFPEDNKNLMTAYNKLKDNECLITFINKKTQSCATRLIKLGA
jgi:hypothetical protein